jgi:hypothetical protein
MIIGRGRLQIQANPRLRILSTEPNWDIMKFVEQVGYDQDGAPR